MYPRRQALKHQSSRQTYICLYWKPSGLLTCHIPSPKRRKEWNKNNTATTLEDLGHKTISGYKYNINFIGEDSRVTRVHSLACSSNFN
jgi:hypothetical protein